MTTINIYAMRHKRITVLRCLFHTYLLLEVALSAHPNSDLYEFAQHSSRQGNDSSLQVCQATQGSIATAVCQHCKHSPRALTHRVLVVTTALANRTTVVCLGIAATVMRKLNATTSLSATSIDTGQSASTSIVYLCASCSFGVEGNQGWLNSRNVAADIPFPMAAAQIASSSRCCLMV